LSGGPLDGAMREKGRFRSYLLGALKHFLSDQRVHAQAQKRGGDVIHQALEMSDRETANGFPQIADAKMESPDAAYDRQWALTLLARALDELSCDMMAEGKQQHFETLKPWLTGDDEVRQGEAAVTLGISTDAVKVAVHRLRKRFRESVKSQINHTVEDPAQVREEMDHLQRVLRG